MKDVLGRELKDGDMCVGMAIGRNSSGMHIGVFQGSSVCYLGGYHDDYINKSCTGNTYLIENPSEQELEIKEKIQKLLDEEENERKRKASLKTIPLSKLEVGGIYKSTQGDTYVYLGKRKATFETPSGRKEEKEGNCFVPCYITDRTSDEGILEYLLSINTYYGTHNVSVIKGNKKLTEMVRKVDLEFPLKATAEGCFSRWYNECYTLTIE